MAAKLMYDPTSGALRYACGVSGSGSNYEKIYERNPKIPHVVFSNASDCLGVSKARGNGVPIVLLDSTRYFREMWGLDNIPRHGVERNSYDIALMTLVEQTLNGQPDLICLAGYDLWIGDWMVHRYYPKILNVHPGDARKYVGLGWRPTAKAILAEEENVKSTVFFVDESDDGGPILIQSASVPLSRWDNELRDIRKFAESTNARTLKDFREAAEKEGSGLYKSLEQVSTGIQEILKVEGDWRIYPFAVHDLIAKGRVALDGRTVYIDGVRMPPEGWQVDHFGFADNIG
ncbi:MAG: Phosphoribosylglycinamide formyltransferase [Syntrophorhabdus sp. PtaU1.Bin153]|nr:MAG: Phosphoribosylglycinamide formyltransferase [Syntrophorhabdus sp. PtaU1.Bin153]